MLAKNVKELGAVLREARTRKGLTQREVAQQIKVTQSVISKVEKGYPGASIGLIFQILRALGLRMNIEEAVPSRQWDDNLVELDAIANTGLRQAIPPSLRAKRKWPTSDPKR